MEEYLLKRAKRVKQRFNCNGYEAFKIARAYAQYLNGIEVNAECVGFDEFMEQFEIN